MPSSEMITVIAHDNDLEKLFQRNNPKDIIKIKFASIKKALHNQNKRY